MIFKTYGSNLNTIFVFFLYEMKLLSLKKKREKIKYCKEIKRNARQNIALELEKWKNKNKKSTQNHTTNATRKQFYYLFLRNFLYCLRFLLLCYILSAFHFHLSISCKCCPLHSPSCPLTYCFVPFCHFYSKIVRR